VKAFISWSGETSHKVAVVLKDWLPTVLHKIDPWVSSEDIEKGGRWSVEIAKKLDECDFGILCVDPSNHQSPWLNFEAGALSKSLDEGRVAPFLIGLLPSDVKGPITQFQMTTITESDVGRLVESVNQAMGEEKSPVERVKKTYSFCWPGLKDALRKIDIPAPKPLETQAPESQKLNSTIVEIDTSSLLQNSILMKVLVTLARNLDHSGNRWMTVQQLAENVMEPAK